jgi:hypothetical protein
MPVNYSQATINARLGDVIAQIGAAGNLVFTDAGNTALVSIPLDPGVGTVSSGVLTFTTPVTGIAALGGVPTLAKIVSGSSTIISGLTVSSGAGSDIFLAPLPLIAGQAVTLSLGSIIGR